MNTISRSILLLMLAPTIPLGCASEPSTASELAAVTTLARSTGISDEQRAARARISASGLYAAPMTAGLGPALATTWGDALDIPEELVVSATIDGAPEAAAVFDDGDLGVVRSSRGGTFVLLSTGVAGANAIGTGVVAEKPEPGTDFLPVDDRAPPEVSIRPMRQLAPPTFRYQAFTLADCAQASDTCEGATDIDQTGQIVAIHSDEPDVAFFFDPGQDIVILENSRFLLRARVACFKTAASTRSSSSSATATATRAPRAAASSA